MCPALQNNGDEEAYLYGFEQLASEYLHLSDILEEFHLNSSYISQLIKSETGLTYTQYVTEQRINKAKEQLKTTKMFLNEVSEAVGFNDYFYFIKKFKREVGITPGKYSS